MVKRIVILLLASALVLTGCAKSVATVPEYRNLLPAPLKVTVEQLAIDYISDEAAADAKYKGEKLLFSQVEVEEVVMREYRALLTDITDDNGKSYLFVEGLVAGGVRFELDDFALQQNIEPGMVLNNVVGECRGLENGLVAIRDSSVDSIEGEIGPIKEISDSPY